jgi:hypothetical protein
VKLKDQVDRIATYVGYVASIFGVATGIAWAIQIFLPRNVINLEIENNAIIPHCLELHGSAPKRRGMSLVESHHSASGRYYFNKVVRGEGEKFTMTSNVGGDSATGQSFFVDVFYLPDDTANFVLSIDGSGPTGNAT